MPVQIVRHDRAGGLAHQAGSARSSLRWGLVAVGVLLLLGAGGAAPSTSPAQPVAPDSARPADDSTRSRRAALQSAREAKAAAVHPPDPGWIEEAFLWLEENRIFRRIGGLQGQKIRVLPGGLGRGSGVGARLAYVPVPLRSDLDLRVSGGASVFGYWQVVGSVGLRRGPAFGYVYGQGQRRVERTFVPIEGEPDRAASRDFDVVSWTGGGVLGLRPAPGLSVAASGAYIAYTPSVPAGQVRPESPNILNPAVATRYVSAGGHLTLDRRDVRYDRDFGTRYIPSAEPLTDRPLNPDRGTLASLDVTRFFEVSGPTASYTQTTAEVQQYVSFFNGYHTFALRHRSVFTTPDAGAKVPFYRLPYVGGNFTLRGYDEFRFRGARHALLYNLEYRYKVWHHLDMVLFGDAGKTFDEADRWGVTDLRYSYGAGIRFVTKRFTLARLGIAFDEDRDTRIVFEFNNVF